MRIGVDFGTTRVVVAAVDRGNFPIVYFETPDGQMRDWFPPLAAVNGSKRLYGWEAVAVQDDAVVASAVSQTFPADRWSADRASCRRSIGAAAAADD